MTIEGHKIVKRFRLLEEKRKEEIRSAESVVVLASGEVATDVVTFAKDGPNFTNLQCDKKCFFVSLRSFLAYFGLKKRDYQAVEIESSIEDYYDIVAVFSALLTECDAEGDAIKSIAQALRKTDLKFEATDRIVEEVDVGEGLCRCYVTTLFIDGKPVADMSNSNLATGSGSEWIDSGTVERQYDQLSDEVLKYLRVKSKLVWD